MSSFNVGFSFESYVANVFKSKSILFSSNANIYTPVSPKPSTIDYIVYGSKCIYCIECKYYSGELRGNYSSNFWSLKGIGKTLKVFNPVRQNLKHCRLIQNICRNLNMNIPVISIILISNKCDVYSDVNGDFFTLEEFIYIYNKIEINGFLDKEKCKNIIERCIK